MPHDVLPDATTDLPPPPSALLAGASLFLDFDGTLVEIAPRPEGVKVDARLRALLRRLAAALPGRVALVSGRPAQQVVDFIGDDPDICIAIAGSHGMEFHWTDGRVERPERPAALDAVQDEMDALAARTPGLRVERKPLGVGLHFRAAPEAEDLARRLAVDLAEAHGLYLQHGKMLFEVRAGGGDKGSAIRSFMAQPPFAGTRPVFLGDDVTDEAGFEAVATLDGAGILVGDPRATAAAYRLPGVAATLAWLEAAAEALA